MQTSHTGKLIDFSHNYNRHVTTQVDDSHSGHTKPTGHAEFMELICGHVIVRRSSCIEAENFSTSDGFPVCKYMGTKT